MDNETNAVDKNVVTPAAAEPVVDTSTTTADDVEAKLAALEEAKNKALEEAANWKVAALKEKSKNKESFEDETEEERIERIVQEKLSEAKIQQIDTEKEALLIKLAKENKELKLAHLNKTTATPPASVGTHSETMQVTDTSITPEQMAAFKARGWTDKEIERYKANLRRYSGR